MREKKLQTSVTTAGVRDFKSRPVIKAKQQVGCGGLIIVKVTRSFQVPFPSISSIAMSAAVTSSSSKSEKSRFPFPPSQPSASLPPFTQSTIINVDLSSGSSEASLDLVMSLTRVNISES